MTNPVTIIMIEDDEGHALRRTLGFAHLGGATPYRLALTSSDAAGVCAAVS